LNASACPSPADLIAARSAFEANEPRNLFYRAATELVGLALRKKTDLTVAEALAVLLQTWNMAYYRYRPFDAQHFADLEKILASHEKTIRPYRKRAIETYNAQGRSIVQRVFTNFEDVLGPVGAAKCLHLLAPQFFPLWDRAIAQAYGVALKNRGSNAARYTRFMELTKRQATALANAELPYKSHLKALDEYNYCKFTKRWL
jgi:hypothetical protein